MRFEAVKYLQFYAQQFHSIFKVNNNNNNNNNSNNNNNNNNNNK